jgi:hypothetical protein
LFTSSKVQYPSLLPQAVSDIQGLDERDLLTEQQSPSLFLISATFGKESTPSGIISTLRPS